MKRSVALAIALGCSGCFLFGNDDAGDPCDADRYGCADGELDVDPSCELVGELVVTIGEGEGEFEPLPEGVAPTIHTGSQGGQHVLVGVRIDNAALDRYDELQAQIGLYSTAQCPAPEGDDLLTPCTGAPAAGSRTVVLGDAAPLAVTDAGIVEEHDIIVFVEDTFDVIEAILIDPCGRQGLARHRI